MNEASSRRRRQRHAALGVALLGSLVLSIVCGGPTSPSRTACAGPYPDQGASPYILPWPPGESYRIGQGNCGSGSHAAGTTVQYAYDILMPIGTTILAARSGRVLLVEERFRDGTRLAGEENYVNVVHADGSIAGYVHLTTNGALVEVGDLVAQGQPIGLSGDSGSSSEPHLHFHVQSCDGCPTTPVTFRNTKPHPRGLVQGEVYAAEPFDAAARLTGWPLNARAQPSPAGGGMNRGG